MNGRQERYTTRSNERAIVARELRELGESETPNPHEDGAGRYLREGLGIDAWTVEEWYDYWGAEVVKAGSKIAYDFGVGHDSDRDVTTFFQIVRKIDPETIRELVIQQGIDPTRIAEDFRVFNKEGHKIAVPMSTGLTSTQVLGTTDLASRLSEEHGLNKVYGGSQATVFDYVSK